MKKPIDNLSIDLDFRIYSTIILYGLFIVPTSSVESGFDVNVTFGINVITGRADKLLLVGISRIK